MLTVLIIMNEENARTSQKWYQVIQLPFFEFYKQKSCENYLPGSKLLDYIY